MSAYLCDQDTINAIATFAADHGLMADAAQFAELLTLQNVRSMQARYPGREWLKAEVIDVAATYVYERLEWPNDVVERAAEEYDYQACETDDYESTLCAQLIKRVIDLAHARFELEVKGGCGAARLGILWTAKSTNAKTGPIPVSTTAPESCPDDCLFRGNGCYAENGPLGFLWRALGEHGPNASWRSGVATVKSTDWNGLCKNVEGLAEGQLWRHNQAGDLPKVKGTGRIDAARLRRLVRANAKAGARGWTYTHHNVLQDLANRDLVREANDAGFVINLSGNSLAHADALMKTGAGPVVVVLPREAGPERVRTPDGHVVVPCPAVFREDVSCATCGLCAVASRRTIVGFPAHGARAKAASAACN